MQGTNDTGTCSHFSLLLLLHIAGDDHEEDRRAKTLGKFLHIPAAGEAGALRWSGLLCIVIACLTVSSQIRTET